jgi:purine-cytosine permease-like protein
MFFGAAGLAAALIYMQVTSIVALQFGSTVVLVAVLYSCTAAGLIGFRIANVAIETGLGTKLLARFVLGYHGAALFSLLFGVTTLVYFVAEASIMGTAIGGLFGAASRPFVQAGTALAIVPQV